MSDTSPTLHSPDEITIVRWIDPLVERLGHDALGSYVETFWLGILGPTATWLLRRLVVLVVAHPDGHSLDVPATATALGLGGESGRKAALGRAVNRLVMFGLARHVNGALAVRTVVPPLSMRHLMRLPERLQSAHALWNEDDPRMGMAVAIGIDAELSAAAS